MHASKLFLIIFLFFIVACGRTPPPPTTLASTQAVKAPPPSAPASSGPAREERCREAARACGAALIAGDNEKTADCMPPEGLAASGGRAAVIAELVKGKAQMAKDGVTFERSEIDTPRDVALGGEQLFAIVPQRVIMKVPQGHLLQHSFLLGVSGDGGQTWRFVDGAPLNQKNVKRLFPKFPSELVLPAVAQPELVP